MTLSRLQTLAYGDHWPGESPARCPVCPGHSARCSHECQALSCELVVTEGGRVQSELHAPIMLSRTLSPSALLLTLSHLASGARDTGANVPSDLVTGRSCDYKFHRALVRKYLMFWGGFKKIINPHLSKVINKSF